MMRHQLFIASFLIFVFAIEDQAFSQEKTSVDDVIDLYIEGLGGLSRLEKVESLKIKESTEERNGQLVMPYNSRLISGAKYVQTNSDGTRFGCDGETYWFKQRLAEGLPGPTIIGSQSLQVLARDPIGFPLWLHRNRKQLRVSERTDPMKTGFVISVRPPETLPGDMARKWPLERIFEGGQAELRLIRFESSEFTFGDYRKVEEIAIPFRRIYKSLNPKITRTEESTITSIEFSIDVDDQVFQVPK